MIKPKHINLIISITLILTIGLLTGYCFGYYRANRNHFPEIKFVKDINQGTATVKLMEVKNGKLIGEIVGQNTRIAYNSNNIIDLNIGDSFEIPINQISLQSYYKAQDIPKDTQFISSSKGKYYYSIFDKRALNISQKNRIYFSNSNDAEKMGYIKK